MKKIGVVTSGGDAPGMNATIRAVTRVARSKRLEVLGFERGWEGLMEGIPRRLTRRSVGGILELGGTVLYTVRSPDFQTQAGIRKASRSLAKNNVDGLVVIGGDGSFKGAFELSKETDIPIVGVPASIDNDIFGTDETIGFDTAVNTVVSEIDKIRDTAISHERIFVVEVMGRTRGFLALTAGITAGAEVILIPEDPLRKEAMIQTIEENKAKGKRSGIIVVAEGVGDSRTLALELEQKTGSEVRLTALGYAQRGGSPTARSRLLGCLFGNKAVELLSKEQENQVVGLRQGRICKTSLEKSCKTTKPIDANLLRLSRLLAT